MAHSNDANFTSEEIDQQIEHYLSGQQITTEERAAQHALQQLQRVYPLLAQVAAVFFCLFLVVGSFVLVTSRAFHQQTTPISRSITGTNGLYAYQKQAIYRLDNQTHQILWKHSFANDETVTGNEVTLSSVNQLPFVKNGILYVETHSNTTSLIKQYLYAISTANGTILWRQSSARAFINNAAIYTSRQ